MTAYSTYSGYVTELKPNQVFVFGSNLDGFHGGGSAGFASFGKAGNTWRAFDYAGKPDGWKGLWNVKGVGEGYQEGTVGRSYALPTVVQAGWRKSMSKKTIINHIKKLYQYATTHPEQEFLIAYRHDGSVMLNGYTIEDMAEMFAEETIPANIVFEDRFFELVQPLMHKEAVCLIERMDVREDNYVY
jgi:hypothetical protein